MCGGPLKTACLQQSCARAWELASGRERWSHRQVLRRHRSCREIGVPKSLSRHFGRCVSKSGRSRKRTVCKPKLRRVALGPSQVERNLKVFFKHISWSREALTVNVVSRCQPGNTGCGSMAVRSKRRGWRPKAVQVSTRGGTRSATVVRSEMQCSKDFWVCA